MTRDSLKGTVGLEPRTEAGRRILRQDYRGTESYTVTREDILAIEAEAARPLPEPRADPYPASDREEMPSWDSLEERARALPDRPEPALDVERLIRHLDSIKRSGHNLTVDSIPFDRGVATAQDAIRSFFKETSGPVPATD